MSISVSIRRDPDPVEARVPYHIKIQLEATL